MPNKQEQQLNRLNTFTQDPALADLDEKARGNELLEPISQFAELLLGKQSGEFMSTLQSTLSQEVEKVTGSLDSRFTSLQQTLAAALDQELVEKDREYLAALQRAVTNVEGRFATLKRSVTPKAGQDFPSYQELFEYIESAVPALDSIAVSAINILESFEGDARLDAKAIRNLEANIDITKLKLPKYDDSKVQETLTKLEGYIQELASRPPRVIERGGGSGLLEYLKDANTTLNGIKKIRFVNATIAKDGDEAVVTVTGGEGGGTGDMLKATYDTDNSGVVDEAEVITGQGALATKDTVDTAEIDDGAVTEAKLNASTNASLDKAVTATQPGDLSTVATTGDYDDLSNKPDLSVYDEVEQYANEAAFPATGNNTKFYLAQDTGEMFRWTGSAYVVISAQLALGETSSTAYRGDRGKIAYDHTFLTNNPHSVTKTQVGLGNVPDVDARARSTHTGTQLASTISNFAATVRATVLTGLSTATATAVTAADSILVAIGKLQAQISTKLSASDIATGTITARADDLDFSGGTDGQVWTVQADGSVAFEAAPGAGGGDAWGDAVDADIVPDADVTRDLGSVANRFAQVYSEEIHSNRWLAETNSVSFRDSDGRIMFVTTSTVGASAAIYITAYPAIEGGVARLQAGGSGTNGGINLIPKGTGEVQINGERAIDETEVTGDFVGTTDTQTLENKTLDDAKIQTAVNAQTGTTYTLVLADASKLVTMSNASANTLTVPPNASVAFPVGTRLMVQQLGAGSTTIAAGSGVTINAPSTVTLEIGEQYESRGILKTSINTWQLI